VLYVVVRRLRSGSKTEVQVKSLTLFRLDFSMSGLLFCRNPPLRPLEKLDRLSSGCGTQNLLSPPSSPFSTLSPLFQIDEPLSVPHNSRSPFLPEILDISATRTKS